MDELVSVVVPTVDRVALLERCLEGFEQDLGAPFEVLVVHDGDPGIVALLERWVDRLPALRPIRIASRGVSAKRNAGWLAARGEVIAYTDDDCQPVAGWLGAALRALAPGIDLVQGRVLPHPADAGVTGLFKRTVRVEGPDIGFANANLVYRRSALDRVGGYDETFRVWGEDADLAWRVLETGGESTYADDALVYHAVRPTTFLQHLRSLRRWADLPLVVRRHPQVRAHLHHRIFWKRSHPTAVLALAGLAGAIADRRALALVLPVVVRRVREAGPSDGLQLAVTDVAEAAVMLVGSAHHRCLLA